MSSGLFTPMRDFLLHASLEAIASEARIIRAGTWGETLTYSRKVFIPLTQLCRDVCHYCTFAKSPRHLKKAYLTLEEVAAIAEEGRLKGCKEALFTLGDKPELRYEAARAELAHMGLRTTVDYVERAARHVIDESGLLPHLNPGLLSRDDMIRLKPVSASMGLMLETTSTRLSAPGGPHYGSPDKEPARRLEMLETAGELAIPMTTGLLIGIGETRAERLDALDAIAGLHHRHAHIQEVIIQNFRAKPGTKMAHHSEPSLEELVWTVAAARLVLDDTVSIQSPPNLNEGRIKDLIGAGINDWGGISPVTADHVNPECAWPEVDTLADQCAASGYALAERLPAYPAFQTAEFLSPDIRTRIMKSVGTDGLPREQAWHPGENGASPGTLAAPLGHANRPARLSILPVIDRAVRGRACEADIAGLFEAREGIARGLVEAADELRRETNGGAVTYVVNRNINYTNICSYKCGFCAFSKTSAKLGYRDKPYVLSPEQVAGRVNEAAEAGATEVCLQGGIHPSYDGDTYRSICRAAKEAQPGIHIHAFSPLEVSHGAETLGLTIREFLLLLKSDGLASLPGTAAEILSDDIRSIICPDKLSTKQWLETIRTAHGIGLPTTATIMFGHVDSYTHWARHLLLIRELQMDTGGFTEFVPLPFVHMQSPIFLKGIARAGPSWRECVLMHAVARIALHGAISNIQASWVKLGIDGAAACLAAGANDIGGVLMNESISRSAGASHGQSLSLDALEPLLQSADRQLVQRSTLYRRAPTSGLQPQDSIAAG